MDECGNDQATLGNIEGLGPDGSVEPLATLTVSPSRPGKIQILDGALRLYHQASVEAGRSVSWLAGGAAGRQVVRLQDSAGRLMAESTFRLHAKTSVADGSGQMARLLRALVDTLLINAEGGGEFIRIDKKIYKFYI